MRRLIEVVLIVTGITLLVWFVATEVRARRYQQEYEGAFLAVPSAPPLPGAPATVEPPPPSRGHPIGLLRVPRLHLSAVVAEGDDDRTLSVAIGHLPDTPLPWHEGNSAIAAHRDTFFRALRDVKIGDELVFSTAEGSLRYVVRGTRVVQPTDLSVLAPTPNSTLTLITCYPFSFLGHAPKRFIVRAERIAPEAKGRS